jgi:hypothetical protein
MRRAIIIVCLCLMPASQGCAVGRFAFNCVFGGELEEQDDFNYSPGYSIPD